MQDLNVSGCPVSDKGIMNLCGTNNTQSTQCEKLVRLDITSTAVNVNGAQLALNNFPNMRFLMFPDVCEALHSIHHQNRRNAMEGVNRTLNLQYISVQQMKPTSAPVTATIQSSCLQCPFITEVHFLRGVDNEGLLLISALKHVRTLHLANSVEELITFDSGVLPVLQLIGSTVEELALNEINDLNVDYIGSCCPDLKNFKCLISEYHSANFQVDSHSELSNTKHVRFRKLEKLEMLLFTAENNLSEFTLYHLIVNAIKLRSLNLAHVNVFGDSNVNSILEKNPLHYLEYLRLECCSHITAEGIWNILESENNLSTLSMLHCFEISRRDYDKFLKYLRSNNCDVNVQWE